MLDLSFFFSSQGLHAVNLGDSGFIVVRDGSTVFRSPVQQHDFNFTYQLESGNAGDLPSSGEVSDAPFSKYYVELGLELMFIGVWKICHTQIKECYLYSVFCYDFSMLLGEHSVLVSLF